MNYQFKTEPMDHQRECWEISKDKAAFAILMEAGTGKTKVALDTIGYLYEKKMIEIAVIVCPRRVRKTWAITQIEEHLPKEIKRKIHVYPFSLKTLGNDYRRVEHGILNIFIFGYDAVVTKAWKPVQALLVKFPAIMILDESSRIKHADTRRTRRIQTIGPLARYRRVMTGTPVTKSYVDLYPQFKFLDAKILGQNKASFCAQFCNMSPIWPGKVDSYRNIDQMNMMIGPHSYVKTKAECLDLLPKIYEQCEFDLNDEEQKAYDGIKEELFTVIKGEELAVRNALAQLMRLQQIACGINPLTGELLIEKPSRHKALMETLEEIAGPTIVWARFKAEHQALKKLFGAKALCAWETETPEQDFQNGSMQIFLGSQAAEGMGLTLTRATNVLYCSNTFNLEERIQSEDRPHRKGQKNQVTIFDLLAEGTVDYRFLEVLTEKKEMADAVMERGMRWFLTGGELRSQPQPDLSSQATNF